MTQHSASGLWSPSTRHSIWAIRLLLATLLFFASEIVLWTSPPTRSLIDWALLAFGYVALSALLLEIAARFRLRDVYGLLTLAGIYGMLNGLILNPQSALSDVPRTLITRAMGAQVCAGLLALTLFLVLAGGALHARRTRITALLLALIVGAGWGLWAHWSPPTFDNQPASAPETVLLYGALSLGLIVLALMAVRRSAVAPTDVRLNRVEWAFVLIVLGALLIIHLLQGQVDVLSLSVIVTLSVFSVMIIWFQQHKKGATLLDNLPSAPPSWITLLLLGIVFGSACAVGYNLPRGSDGNNPLALIGALFTAYGLIWLPALTLVLGARAFTRQARAMRL